MQTASLFAFPPYRLDLRAERLWRDDEAIRLTPQSLRSAELSGGARRWSW